MEIQQKHISFLLHFYQPYWQDKETLKRIVGECYEPLFDLFIEHDYPKLTVNINFSLLELLQNHKHDRVLKQIKQFLHSGRGELTGTAAYHPILPLIPAKERRRQIELNRMGVKEILGLEPGPGFFPPEMAFSPDIAPDIKENHNWTIIDDTVFASSQNQGFAPCKFILCHQGLPVVMRSNLWSNKLAFNKHGETAENFVYSLREDLDNWFKEENQSKRTLNGHFRDPMGYLTIALDAETFGHHPGGSSPEYLLKMIKIIHGLPDMELKTVSELVELFPRVGTKIDFTSSWSTSVEHAAAKIGLPLWDHPENRCHQLLWQLIKLIWQEAERIEEYDICVRKLADKVNNSCQFWWLSAEHWNPKNAFRTMPDILAFFLKRFRGIPLDVKCILGELENLTGEKIL